MRKRTFEVMSQCLPVGARAQLVKFCGLACFSAQLPS